MATALLALQSAPETTSQQLAPTPAPYKATQHVAHAHGHRKKGEAPATNGAVGQDAYNIQSRLHARHHIASKERKVTHGQSSEVKVDEQHNFSSVEVAEATEAAAETRRVVGMRLQNQRMQDIRHANTTSEHSLHARESGYYALGRTGRKASITGSGSATVRRPQGKQGSSGSRTVGRQGQSFSGDNNPVVSSLDVPQDGKAEMEAMRRPVPVRISQGKQQAASQVAQHDDDSDDITFLADSLRHLV